MADQRIDIPGVGVVEFPSSMSDADISAAAKRLYDEAQRTASPVPAVVYDRPTRPAAPTALDQLTRDPLGYGRTMIGNVPRNLEEMVALPATLFGPTPEERDAVVRGDAEPGTHIGRGLMTVARGIPGMVSGAVDLITSPDRWADAAATAVRDHPVDVASAVVGGSGAVRGAVRTAAGQAVKNTVVATPRAVATGVRDTASAIGNVVGDATAVGRAVVAPTERAGTRIGNATQAVAARREARLAGDQSWVNRMASAVKPTVRRGQRFDQDVNLAMPEIDRAMRARGVDEIGSLDDFVKVIDEAEQAVWAEYNALSGGADLVADLTPVRDAIRQSVTQTTRRESPNAVKAIEAMADRWTGTESLSTVEKLLAETNARIKNLQDSPSAAQGRAMRASDDLAAENAKADALRQIIEDTLAKQSGLPGRARELRRHVSALRAVREPAASRAVVESRAQSLSLAEQIGGVMDAPADGPVKAAWGVATRGYRQAAARGMREYNSGANQFNLALKEWRQQNARLPGVVVRRP